MADTPSITRRAIVRAFPALTAAVSIPAAAMALPTEDINDKVRRLTEELSVALNEYADGKFHAVVYPSEATEYGILYVHTASSQRIDDEVRRRTEASYAYRKAHFARRDARKAMERTGYDTPEHDAYIRASALVADAELELFRAAIGSPVYATF